MTKEETGYGAAGHLCFFVIETFASSKTKDYQTKGRVWDVLQHYSRVSMLHLLLVQPAWNLIGETKNCARCLIQSPVVNPNSQSQVKLTPQ